MDLPISGRFLSSPLFSSYKKLKLEGDFNKYFNLIGKEGDEINTLAILTPDVMQTLIANNSTEDVEAYANNAFVMSAQDDRDENSLRSLLTSFIALSTQIEEQVHV
jgi:hypothetical protein